jgi:hypothetical protein
MNDDWRVQVTCQSAATADELGENLRGGDFQHNMQASAGERVIVSVDGHDVFLYAGSRVQAERAVDAVKSLAPGVRTELRRWHPAAEEWIDADLPLPESEAALAAEHAETIERERAESAALKFSEWEVRVTTGSHGETLELAEKLRAEGVPCLRRWRFLLIGAADEDTAKQLADRVRAIAPAGSDIQVEGTFQAIEAETGINPFAVLGGLGG